MFSASAKEKMQIFLKAKNSGFLLLCLFSNNRAMCRLLRVLEGCGRASWYGTERWSGTMAAGRSESLISASLSDRSLQGTNAVLACPHGTSYLPLCLFRMALTSSLPRQAGRVEFAYVKCMYGVTFWLYNFNVIFQCYI